MPDEQEFTGIDVDVIESSDGVPHFRLTVGDTIVILGTSVISELEAAWWAYDSARRTKRIEAANG